MSSRTVVKCVKEHDFYSSNQIRLKDLLSNTIIFSSAFVISTHVLVKKCLILSGLDVLKEPEGTASNFRVMS